jgi:HK97 family phage prohead protease
MLDFDGKEMLIGDLVLKIGVIENPEADYRWYAWYKEDVVKYLEANGMGSADMVDDGNYFEVTVKPEDAFVEDSFQVVWAGSPSKPDGEMPMESLPVAVKVGLLASSAPEGEDELGDNQVAEEGEAVADEAAPKYAIHKLAFYHGTSDMNADNSEGESQVDEKSSLTNNVSSEIIEGLSNRQQINSRFGYGITTASKYVEPIASCVGDSSCDWSERAAQFGNGDWNDLVKRSQSQLVYSNEDMTIQGDVCTNSSDFKSFVASRLEHHKQAGDIHLPPRTIMVFENIVTTPKKDRDNDILRTAGAVIDPNMPLLWQHVQMQPIGKMLKVVKHSKDELIVLTAILDVNPLSEDAAKMVEAEVLRISHGFRPLQYEFIPEKNNEPSGFDITQFEVMEESLVSVPANTDAVITMFSRGKFADPLVKRWAGNLYDERQQFFKGIEMPEDCECGGGCCGGGKKSASEYVQDAIDKSINSDVIDLLQDAMEVLKQEEQAQESSVTEKAPAEPFGGGGGGDGDDLDDSPEDGDAPAEQKCPEGKEWDEKEQKCVDKGLYKEDDEEKQDDDKTVSALVKELTVAVMKAEENDLHDLKQLDTVLSHTVKGLRERVQRLYS